ncbi:MAG: response regulator [Candidatus Margulisbacteria bacterium]|nr:response regulator [Candidatus Margulisiibacteriota bacterium]
MNILIIDDELISRKKLLEILKPLGDCTEISESTEALPAFEKAIRTNHGYNFVALDIRMPDPDGMVILEKMREMEKKMCVLSNKKATIFMVTSITDKQKVLEALKKGANDYIMKPFTAEQLMDRLKLHKLI